ncbi:MAG: DUF1934 domain-containing protein [Firmicutes bacterium]|nr:DUF1934 domain-containing protein [Bacillota bacterium]
MDKNVIISVRGKQSSGDEVSNTLELITEGKYYKKDDAYYITYNESEVTGMEGTTTTIKVADGIVTLMREGSVNSQFVFQKGYKHVSYYDTSYGAFTVGVFASDVSINMNDYGGEISVDYHIEINNKTGYNDFYMSIREVGCSNDKCCGTNEKKY